MCQYVREGRWLSVDSLCVDMCISYGFDSLQNMKCSNLTEYIHSVGNMVLSYQVYGDNILGVSIFKM